MSNHSQGPEAQSIQEITESSGSWCKFEILCGDTLSIIGNYCINPEYYFDVLALLAARGAKTEAQKVAERFRIEEIQGQVSPQCSEAQEMVRRLRNEIALGEDSSNLRQKILDLERRLTEIKILLIRNELRI